MSLNTNLVNLLTTALGSRDAAQNLVNAINTSTTEGDPINTAISTVGAGTLTAAALTGGVITRSGSVAAYIDTTATALQLWNQQSSPVANESYFVYIKNTVAFPETITGGVGVTVSGVSVIPPNSTGTFLVTLTSSSAATMIGLMAPPLSAAPVKSIVAISTAGAGTLTAAAVVGGVVNRTGSSAAFTDTIDTAANIIAALPSVSTGYGFTFEYQNKVAFPATIATAAGVTLAGLVVVPPLSVGRFFVKVDSGSAVTVTGISSEPLVCLPPTKHTIDSTGTQTADAGDLTGANHVYWENTANGAVALTTRTAAEMFGDIPNCQIGFAYMLTVVANGDNTVTFTAGANVTITGTATVATNTTRTFVITFTSASACTAKVVNKGTVE